MELKVIKYIRGGFDKEIANGFIERNKYNPYRNIKFYTDLRRLKNYYYNLFFSEPGLHTLVAFNNKEAVGALTFFISKWDCEAFGMKMAKIGIIMAGTGYSDSFRVKDRLIKEAIGYLRSERVKFLSLRVDAEDLSSIHALEKNNFRIMDNLVTYIFRREGRNGGRPIFPGDSRWFDIKRPRKEDLDAAGDLLVDRCIAGHFSVDPRLPPSGIKYIYRKWLESSFNDPKCNDVFIVKRGGSIVGCSIFSLNVLLAKYTGLRSLHRGLVAVDPAAPGCLIALVDKHIEKREWLDFAEFDTHGTNYNMLNTMRKLNMRLVQSRYAFHRPL